MQERTPSSQEASRENSGKISKTFEVRGNKVHLSGQEFQPTGEVVPDPTKAVLFLVGAPMRARASTTWGQPKELADQFGVKAYTLDARPLGRSNDNSIQLEAEALRQFTEEQGIKELTIFGHSIGAIKAGTLAALLEANNPDIKINGVVLANPIGLYEQRSGLLWRWVKEAASQGKYKNPNSPHENLGKVFLQMAQSVGKDISQTGVGFKKWAGEQLDALTQVNPDLKAIKAPVVLLVAEHDLLSEKSRILPDAEIDSRLPETSSQGELMRKIMKEDRKWEDLSETERKVFGEGEALQRDSYLTLQRQQWSQRGKARNEYVKEKLLPNAKEVMVINVRKFGSHVGTTVERVKQTGHVASRIFERLAREKSNP